MRMFYRLRQLWESLYARPTAPDLALAQDVLAPPLMALFLRLQPSEQAHSLRILCQLLEQGENHPDLLVAALLHDVGKSRYPLHVWERVLIVVGKALLPKQARRWGQGQPGLAAGLAAGLCNRRAAPGLGGGNGRRGRRLISDGELNPLPPGKFTTARISCWNPSD